MKVLKQENSLLTVDQIPANLEIGDQIRAAETGEVVEVVYIDRDNGEIGVLRDKPDA